MSESSPNASVCVTNWEMLPGKISTKKAATIHPIGTRQRVRNSTAAPNAISTMPEAITTKSAFNGSHGGTWA